MFKKLTTLSLVVFCVVTNAKNVDFTPVKRGFAYIVPKIKKITQTFNARRLKTKRDEAFAFTQLTSDYGTKLAALQLAHEQALKELHDEYFKVNEDATTAQLNETLREINAAYTAAKDKIKKKYANNATQVTPEETEVTTVAL
jgi:hypothetical protein